MTRDDPTPEKDGCTTPPVAIPPSELHRYRAEEDSASEQDIVRYVEIQTGDEIVLHAERIKREYALGETVDVWDVTTDKRRWWVLTNLTNLYPQDHFQSLDYTLSFHIGLMIRMRSRPDGAEAADPTPFDDVLRRQEQAKHRFDRAIEPEDFQGVGVQLRECLLSLASALKRRLDPPVADQPQAANFTAWYDLLMDQLCRGSKNKELRHHLKTTARSTWQLVGWLVHDQDANKTAAMIAIHACDTLVGHTLSLFMRDRADLTDSCPQCSSRDVRRHFDPAIGADGQYYQTCGACHWSSHPGGLYEQPGR